MWLNTSCYFVILHIFPISHSESVLQRMWNAMVLFVMLVFLRKCRGLIRQMHEYAKELSFCKEELQVSPHQYGLSRFWGVIPFVTSCHWMSLWKLVNQIDYYLVKLKRFWHCVRRTHYSFLFCPHWMRHDTTNPLRTSRLLHRVWCRHGVNHSNADLLFNDIK